MEGNNSAIEEKPKKEDINEQIKEKPKEEKALDEQEKQLDKMNSEEYELKEHYSIDDISFSKFENNDEEENSIISNKKRKINNLSQAILENNLENFKNILKDNESLINKKTLEGFSFIQYAALNGSIDCFKYLLSLKVRTDEDIEGFYLIHLPLINCLFNKNKNKCIQMFNYIYQNLPEQKKFKDRLGRTFLHLIFEYDIAEALNNINIEINDLFIKDNNENFVINYTYLYNARDCFLTIAKESNNLHDMYLKARELNKQFLENLFIYHNYHTISIVAYYCQSFLKEFQEDLKNIHEKYYELFKDDGNNIENSNIYELIGYIQYIFEFLKYIQSNPKNDSTMFDCSYFKQPSLTAIVFNKDCINHIKLPDKKDTIKYYKKKSKLFENSDRLSCLINEEDGILLNNQVFNYGGELQNIIFQGKFCFIKTQRKSCLNDILKCHDIKYIKALKYKSDNIKKMKNTENNEVPKFWDNIDLDLIEKNYFLYNNNNNDNNESIDNDNTENSLNLYNYKKIDIDTFINQYSYENIFNTTGCVFDAIDIVMTQQQVFNSIAIIRPPGHHSGYYGPVENKFGTSNGFCIVNNVAIGAAYTKYKYNEIIKKIAIVDIDIHHGNGTEEIVEMLNYKNFTKPFNYEKVCGVKITEKQNINWLDFDDAKNVLFISTHIYDKNKPDNFYPYSGSIEKNTKKDSDIYPGGIYNVPLEYKENYPFEYKNILRSKIIPRLYKFKPDIIFISAGFDGHKLEKINNNLLLLQENDYGYIAQQLQLVANKFCNGRMVTVLEGGYNTNTGIISSFAQSVFYFIRFMNIGANMLQCRDVKLTKEKRKIQYEEEMELYNNLSKPKIKPRRSDRLKQMEKNKENKNEEIKETETNKEDIKVKENKDNIDINNLKNNGEKNIKADDDIKINTTNNINEKNNEENITQNNSKTPTIKDKEKK